jgi:hypothetical protein
VAAGADTHVKGFTDACCKGEEGIAEGIVLKGVASKGVVCREDREDKQRREKVVASPIKVELRRLWRDTVIISLSSTSTSVSLSFVQTCCSSFKEKRTRRQRYNVLCCVF